MENNIKLNVVFSVIMFAIYIRFFGYQSVERFNRHGITAIKLTEEGKTIPPPGLSIEVIGNLSNGWKVDFQDNDNICQNKSGKLLKQCIEENTFSVNETFTDIKLNQSTRLNIMKIKPYLGDLWNGLVLSIHLEPKMITNYAFTSLSAFLNPNMSYRIRVMDPKLEFLGLNPDTIPRTLVRLGHYAGVAVVYLKVIRHEELNNPDSPCEPAPDYDFSRCVETFIATKVGCQPYWRRFEIEKMETCDTWSKLKQYYFEHYVKYIDLTRNDIVDGTNCLFPCTFMEYKLTDDPFTGPTVDPGTQFTLVFSTNTLEVIKEEPAFPITSFVADCGGVLGLFIGFNFIMVFDWIVWAAKMAFVKMFHSVKK